MPTTYRKRTYRKKAYGKKKTYAKKSNVVARNVNLKKDLHFFKRGSMFPAEIVGNAAYTTGVLQQAQTFSMNQIINYGEFTSLFDRYMISHVQVKIYMKSSPDAQTATTAWQPRIWWIKDYDDNGPASISDMREHAKAKSAVLRTDRPIVINIKPAILSAVYRTALTTGYSPKWNTWIDCANIDVPHYGLKWVVDRFDNLNYTLQFETTYWVRCKDTR